MKRFTTLMAATALWLGSSATVFATEMEDIKIDITETTCQEASELGAEKLGMLLIWMDGYLSGKDSYVHFEVSEVTALYEDMAAYCTAHPDAVLLTAMQESGEE